MCFEAQYLFLRFIYCLKIFLLIPCKDNAIEIKKQKQEKSYVVTFELEGVRVSSAEMIEKSIMLLLT